MIRQKLGVTKRREKSANRTVTFQRLDRGESTKRIQWGLELGILRCTRVWLGARVTQETGGKSQQLQLH